MNELLKSKTVWTGIAGVVAAVGGYATGSLDLGMALQAAVTSLIGIFLRAGIAKQGGKQSGG